MTNQQTAKLLTSILIGIGSSSLRFCWINHLIRHKSLQATIRSKALEGNVGATKASFCHSTLLAWQMTKKRDQVKLSCHQPWYTPNTQKKNRKNEDQADGFLSCTYNSCTKQIYSRPSSSDDTTLEKESSTL